jgi:hypothetical protein
MARITSGYIILNDQNCPVNFFVGNKTGAEWLCSLMKETFGDLYSVYPAAIPVYGESDDVAIPHMNVFET